MIETPDSMLRKVLKPAHGIGYCLCLLTTPPGDVVREQIRFRTRFFALNSQVVFADMPIFMSSLFETRSASTVTLVARRWTSDE